MQIIEVTDVVEARRAKGAQYTGINKTLNLAGETVFGIVQSVVEDCSKSTPKWIVRILPAPERRTFTKIAVRARKR